MPSVLRRVQHELGDRLTVLWVQTGLQRYNTRASQNTRHESRALNGFLDGTNNLNPADPDDRALIFIDHAHADYPPVPNDEQYGATFSDLGLRPPPSGPEPAVLDGGTYMAVEVMLLNTTAWDKEPRTEQEQSIGRDKETGQEVAAGADPISHVRKSNPGRPEDTARRILRRGYSMIESRPDGLGRGLVFIAFGRTLSTQVEFIQRAWINNPNFPQANSRPDSFMSRFVQPRLVCGGFYFVPPLQNASQPWSWVV